MKKNKLLLLSLLASTLLVGCDKDTFIKNGDDKVIDKITVSDKDGSGTDISVDLTLQDLYETLKTIGRPVQSVRRHLKAEKATKEIARYLEMEINEPIMLSKTLGKDDFDIPVEYSVARYNGAYADFQIDLQLK